MGYPNHYVGRYRFLADWLVSQGHLVYPMEMICEPLRDDKRGPCCFVDVVSLFRNKLWAWEYKSHNDSVLRGITQVKNYCRSFDYVSLVVEDLAKAEAYVRKKRLRVNTILKALGVGIFWDDEDIIKEVVSPSLQTPKQEFRDKLVVRFRRNVLRKPFPQSPSQTSLRDYAVTRSCAHGS